MSTLKEQIKLVPHSKGNALTFIHQYLAQNDVRQKTVIDVSAGSGYVANLWHKAGATVRAFDMHPDILRSDALTCSPIDLTKPLPIASNSADYVLLMETIEHIPDQTSLLKELARILKPNGLLIITKPNNSSMSGRMANVWVEAERSDMFLSNEAEVIGYDDQHLYNGRVYLCNVQRLRTMASLAGLKYRAVYPNQLSVSSLIWFLFFGVYLYLRSFLTLNKMTKHAHNDREKDVLREQHQLNIHPTVLLHKHLCITFSKL